MREVLITKDIKKHWVEKVKKSLLIEREKWEKWRETLKGRFGYYIDNGIWEELFLRNIRNKKRLRWLLFGNQYIFRQKLNFKPYIERPVWYKELKEELKKLGYDITFYNLIHNRLANGMKLTKLLRRKLESWLNIYTDWLSTVEAKSKEIIISTSPVDIAQCSYNTPFSSCFNPEGSSSIMPYLFLQDRWTVIAGWKHKEGYWKERVFMHVYFTDDNTPVVISGRPYGDKIGVFVKSIREWIESKINDKTSWKTCGWDKRWDYNIDFYDDAFYLDRSYFIFAFPSAAAKKEKEIKFYWNWETGLNGEKTDGFIVGDRAECVSCGAEIDREEAIVIDGEYYCNECAGYCAHCESLIVYDEANYTVDGYVCDSCYNVYYTTCEACETAIHVDDAYVINPALPDERVLCAFCFDNAADVYACEECGEYFTRDNLHEINGAFYCDNCYIERREE